MHCTFLVSGHKRKFKLTPLPEMAVDGIVDLPNADSLFQAMGLPAGAAPQAPPDNVILLPLARWHEFFEPQAILRPDSVKVQLHIGLRHEFLPGDPAAAYAQAANAGRNLEARIAGSGLNLVARLDAVRADALNARVLFLFLGAPGALLAVLRPSRSPHRVPHSADAIRRCFAFAGPQARGFCCWRQAKH